MRRIVIKAGTLGTGSALGTNRRRANDNDADADIVEAVQGELTPVSFYGGCIPDSLSHHAVNGSVVHWTRSTIVAGTAVSNSNRPGQHRAGRAAALLGCVAQLWAAFRRERAVARSVSKLSSMSDRDLRDIGIDRGRIAFAVRHGRDHDLKSPERRES